MKTWTRRIQIQDCYNVNVLFQREGETERSVGRHSILASRMAVTRLNKMANINGNIYLKPCDGLGKDYALNE